MKLLKHNLCDHIFNKRNFNLKNFKQTFLSTTITKKSTEINFSIDSKTFAAKSTVLNVISKQRSVNASSIAAATAAADSATERTKISDSKLNLNLKINKNDTNVILPFEKIPTAKGLPIVGTLLDFIAAGSAPQLHKYIHKRHEQFGPIFRECLGGTQDAVFVSSASLMRSVFIYEGQYPTHPLPESWTLYNQKHKCRRGLFFMNGPEWLHNRRIMNKFLLNGDCDWINQHIEISTKNLIDKWKLQCNNGKGNEFIEIENLESQLYRWSIDVLTSLMFGHTFHNASDELLEEIDKFSKNVYKIFETTSSLMNFPPKLAETLKLKIWTEFEESVTRVLEMGNSVVDKCIEDFGNGDGLLAKMRAINMPMDDIKRIFVDLIIAAGDTTAFSTQWALYLLATQNNVQKTVQNALKLAKNIDGEIPYVKGLIRETLRLYPVAPFIGRFLSCDAVIGNYRINKNTLVLLSLYTSGRTESHFPDALKISPERWIRNQNNGEMFNVLQAQGSLPFAMGSRSCIGRKIAMQQMHSIISQIVSNFELKCLNPTKIDVILRLVAVPDQPVQLAIKNHNNKFKINNN